MYFNKFWYKYKNFLKDRKEFYSFFEKYERSELCEEEIFYVILLKCVF